MMPAFVFQPRLESKPCVSSVIGSVTCRLIMQHFEADFPTRWGVLKKQLVLGVVLPAGLILKEHIMKL